MRTHCRFMLTILLLAFAVAGCGGGQAPPGRWEGFSQSANWVVAVRLQVDKGNVIHATALSVQVKDVSLPERLNLTRKVKAMLPEEWKQAPLGKVDFKNNVITRAGGIAPLFAFDPDRKTMTFHFYAGGKLTERIKLYPVKEFMVTSQLPHKTLLAFTPKSGNLLF